MTERVGTDSRYGTDRSRVRTVQTDDGRSGRWYGCRWYGQVQTDGRMTVRQTRPGPRRSGQRVRYGTDGRYGWAVSRIRDGYGTVRVTDDGTGRTDRTDGTGTVRTVRSDGTSQGRQHGGYGYGTVTDGQTDRQYGRIQTDGSGRVPIRVQPRVQTVQTGTRQVQVGEGQRVRYGYGRDGYGDGQVGGDGTVRYRYGQTGTGYGTADSDNTGYGANTAGTAQSAVTASASNGDGQQYGRRKRYGYGTGTGRTGTVRVTVGDGVGVGTTGTGRDGRWSDRYGRYG